MRNKPLAALLSGLLSASVLPAPAARGAEIVPLDKDNWHLVPGGKEVDAIYGDHLMRNDKVVVVIGSAIPNRQLNLRISQAQGTVVDFALVGSRNDQLTAYQPHAFAGPGPAADRIEVVKPDGAEVVLRATRKAKAGDPVETVTDYTLRDGEARLRVVTRRRNTGDRPAKVRLTERLFHERPAANVPPGQHDVV